MRASPNFFTSKPSPGPPEDFPPSMSSVRSLARRAFRRPEKTGQEEILDKPTGRQTQGASTRINNNDGKVAEQYKNMKGIK